MLEHVDRLGSYKVENLFGDVVWFQFDGGIAASLWAPTQIFLERVIEERGQVLMLGNGELWTSYEAGYRQGCTAWFLRRRQKISAVHLLTRSTLLQMGINLVNLAIPIITAYSDPQEFWSSVSAQVPTLETRLERTGLRKPGSAT